jgi:hypothetical protein
MGSLDFYSIEIFQKIFHIKKSLRTLSKMTLIIRTLSIMTLSIRTLSIRTLSIRTLRLGQRQFPKSVL